MKKLLLFCLLLTAISGCSLWNKAFPTKYGCKTSANNKGAEQVDLSSKKQAKYNKNLSKF